MSAFISTNYNSISIKEPIDIRCIAYVLNIIAKDIITSFIKAIISVEDIEKYKNSEILFYLIEQFSNLTKSERDQFIGLI
jgi:hypothetical protein